MVFENLFFPLFSFFIFPPPVSYWFAACFHPFFLLLTGFLHEEVGGMARRRRGHGWTRRRRAPRAARPQTPPPPPTPSPPRSPTPETPPTPLAEPPEFELEEIAGSRRIDLGEGYDDRINDISNIRYANSYRLNRGIRIPSLQNAVRNLPIGYGFPVDTTFYLGLSIGELCYHLRQGGVSLHGLYLSAMVRKVDKRRTTDRDHRNVIYRSYVQDNRMTYLHLEDVIVVDSIGVVMNPGNRDKRREAITGDLERLTRAEGTAQTHLRGIQEVLETRAQVDAGELEFDQNASVVTAFYIIDEAHLVRLQPALNVDNPPPPANQGGFTTAGFSELLCSSVSKTFTYSKETLKVSTLSNVLSSSSSSTHLSSLDVVVPGGGGNCIERCLYEFFWRDLIDGQRVFDVGEITLRKDEAKHVLLKVKEKAEFIHAQMRVDSNRKRSKLAFSQTKVGYSSKQISLLKTILSNEGYMEECGWHNGPIDLRVWYEKEVVRRGKMCITLKEVSPSASSSSNPLMKRCDMMRIDYSGKFRVHSTKSVTVEDVDDANEEDEIENEDTDGFFFEPTKNFSNILHAVLFYPSFPNDILNVSWARKDLLKMVENEFTCGLMDKVKNEARLSSNNIDSILISQYVNYQLSRQTSPSLRGFNPSTLIYQRKNARYASRTNAILSVMKKNPSNPAVFSFDLESVPLTRELFQKNPYIREKYFPADEEVLRRIEEDVGERPSPGEYQIPYCAMYALCRLQDDPFRSEMKRKLDIPVRREPTYGLALSHEFFTKWIEGKNNKRIKLCNFMRTDVYMLYGNDKLGQCIDDSIDEMTRLSLMLGYNSAYVFAHNGCGYDWFIVRAYLTKHSVKDILKTPRGILSMTIEVNIASLPFQHEVFIRDCKQKTFLLHLRDTKLFVSGSLSRITNDFGFGLRKLTEFPITSINGDNCFDPRIKALAKDYNEHDVICLAYVIFCINKIVSFCPFDYVEGEEHGEAFITPPPPKNLDPTILNLFEKLHPATLYTTKPAICDFVTIMSVVKKILSNYFSNVLLEEGKISYLPTAIDLPFLRSMIDRATIGGRTMPYVRSFASPGIESFYETLCVRKDKAAAWRFLKEREEELEYLVALDATSLYPGTLQQCPHPTGRIRPLTIAGCRDSIMEVECAECESRLAICDRHKTEARSFSIIAVKNLIPNKRAEYKSFNGSMISPNYCGRKLGVDGKNDGVVYSFETDEELRARGKKIESTKYITNVDLYWFIKAGWSFDVVGGFEFETSFAFTDLITVFFNLRSTAKADGNECLQLLMKLCLNGFFGVQCQHNIMKTQKVLSLPAHFQGMSIKDPSLQKHLRANYSSSFDNRYYFTDIYPLRNGQSVVCASIHNDIGCVSGESGNSPNHIGCATLCWARHVMNLLLFKVDPYYTDTDSIYLHRKEYIMLQSSHPHLFDETGRTLLTFKNDLGAGNLITTFFAGAKKVKQMVTISWDSKEEGKCDVDVVNTFKGFIRQPFDPETGRILNPKRLIKQQSRLLGALMYDFHIPTYRGDVWNRSVGGITISRNTEVSGADSTYLSEVGEMFSFQESGCITRLVPHGFHVVSSSLNMIRTIDIEDGSKLEDAKELVIKCTSNIPHSLLETVYDYVFGDDKELETENHLDERTLEAYGVIDEVNTLLGSVE